MACRFLRVSHQAWVVACLGALAFLRAAPVVRAEEPPVRAGLLEPGLIAERSLAAGERHAYDIAMAPGDALEVTVSQPGTDVAVAVLGPEGDLLDEFDQLIEDQGPERVTLLAEVAGRHQLVVQSESLPGIQAGRYRLVAGATRPATASDLDGRRQRRAHRENLVRIKARVDELRRKGTIDPAEFADLYDALEATVEFSRAEGQRRQAALAADVQGYILLRLHEWTSLLEHSQQRLGGLTGAAYAGLRGQALNHLAEAYTRTGESQRAIEAFLEARALPQTPLQEAITLDNLGAAYRRVNRFQEALDAHLSALDAFTKVGARRSQGIVLTRIALVWEFLGDLRKAIDYEERALAVYREVGDRSTEALALYNLSGWRMLLGDVAAAREGLTQILAIVKAVQAPSVEGYALTLLSALHNQSGEYAQAIEPAERALILHRERKERRSEAWTLDELAEAHLGLGRRERAADLLASSLAIAREIGDLNEEAQSLHALGRLAREDGRLETARGQLEDAIGVIELVRRGLGGAQLRSAYSADRHAIHEDYVDVLVSFDRARPGAGFDRQAFEASELSRARSLLDVLAASHADVRAGADPELLRQERDLRQRLNEKDALWRQQREQHGSAAQVKRLGKEVERLAAELALVESRISAQSPAFASLTRPRASSVTQVQQEVLDDDTVLLEYALGRERSWLFAVGATSLDTFELAGRDAIEAAARQLYELLTVPPDGREGSPDLLRDKAARLGHLVLGPVAARLEGSWSGKRLVVVAPGALAYVPFGALLTPTAARGSAPETLLASREVVSLPSASVLAAMRREFAGRPRAARTLAIAADPVFEDHDPRLRRAGRPIPRGVTPAEAPHGAAADVVASARSARSLVAARGGKLSRLPFSRQEAAAIASLVPPGEVRRATDFAASREWATANTLGDYRILHFATHGLINAQDPELSSLVLSLFDERGRSQDGFLRMHDIYNQRLPVELVVLSACQTALGKEVAGEGLVGLTRGFMYAGAKTVVASLWQVDDLATAELMSRFYRGMLKEKRAPAAALRHAQLEMSRSTRWRDPYYWGGFVVQGEWR